MESTPFDLDLERLAAEYQRQREALLAVQKTLRAATGSATSKDRLVSVTLNAQGEITELRFATKAYRTMAPAQLATAIVDTFAAARDALTRTTAAALQPFMLPGVSAADAVSGQMDFEAMFPAEPRPPADLEELFARVTQVYGER